MSIKEELQYHKLPTRYIYIGCGQIKCQSVHSIGKLFTVVRSHLISLIKMSDCLAMNLTYLWIVQYIIKIKNDNLIFGYCHFITQGHVLWL